ncbi:hypothetical protein CT0861_09249 [Colletotrichum tofieldiae]|uniref:Uncharacterized protein n=1 Tax=Colletotrichum tofieldiae TaxID=708197 RepID=A0A161VFK8_9PEZI|nr:hypothetical protein CT0861_09249 [Colletotrichum tofieldiae]
MSSHASTPLALHLRSPVTHNFFTDEHWKPGEMYQEGRTINDFAFIDSQSGRFKSTLLFASILRAFYEHPDWSQLHAFFTKRYGRSQMLVDREARKLAPPDDTLRQLSKKITHFKTDPSSVGLPKDLSRQLAAAVRAVRSRMIGPDPQVTAIGPALSVALGAGGYMDLVYSGQPPGKYPERRRFGSELFDWRDDKFQPVGGPMATTRKGGRARCWAEWAELWSVVAEWVYEYDATSLEHYFLSGHTYKYRLSDEEHASVPIGAKVPRKFLATDAIDAADTVRDVFAQLAKNPAKAQGIEWDFLELEVKQEVRQRFYARFGRKDADAKKNVEGLTRRTPLESWNRLNYDEVSPVALKKCPDTFVGLDWEAWMLSIQGGDVVVVDTLFQALWAIIMLSHLPVNISIADKEDTFQKHRDPDIVYI